MYFPILHDTSHNRCLRSGYVCIYIINIYVATCLLSAATCCCTMLYVAIVSLILCVQATGGAYRFRSRVAGIGWEHCRSDLSGWLHKVSHLEMLAATPAMSLEKVDSLHIFTSLFQTCLFCSEARLTFILEYTNRNKLKHRCKWLLGQATLLPSLLRVHLRMVVPMALIDFAISKKEMKVHGYRWFHCQMQEQNNWYAYPFPLSSFKEGSLKS